MSKHNKEQAEETAKLLAEANKHLAILAKKSPNPEDEMTWGQIANQFSQGLSMNTSDEIKAGFKSVFSDETYDEIVAKEREQLKKTQEEFPLQSMGYQAAGAVTTGLAAAPFTLGGSIPATTARLALVGGKTLKQMAGAGALQGALTSAGSSESENITDDLGNILTTTAVSAVANPAVGKLMQGAGAIIKGIGASVFKKYKGADTDVEQELLRIIDQDELTIQEVINKVKNGEIIPEMSDGTRNAVLGYAGKGGKGPQMVSDKLLERKERFIKDTYESLQNDLAPEAQGGNIYQTFLNNTDSLTKQMGKKYESIWESTAGKAHDEIGNAVLKVAKGNNIKIINRYMVNQGLEPIIKIVDGVPTMTRKLDLEQGEFVKRALMDAKNGATNSVGKKTSLFGPLQAAELTIKNSLDNISPILKETRANYAQIFSSINQYKLGQSAITKPTDEFNSMIDKFFDVDGKVLPNKVQDLEALRAGVASYIKKQGEKSEGIAVGQLNKLKTTSDNAKDLAQRSNLEALYPNDKIDDIIKKIDRTTNTIKTQARIDLGSKTKRAQGETENVGKSPSGLLETAKLLQRTVANPLDSDAWRGLLNKLSPKRASEMSDDTMLKIAKILTSEDAELVENALTSTKARELLIQKIDNYTNAIQIAAQKSGVVTTENILDDVNPNLSFISDAMSSEINPSDYRGDYKVITDLTKTISPKTREKLLRIYADGTYGEVYDDTGEEVVGTRRKPTQN